MGSTPAPLPTSDRGRDTDPARRPVEPTDGPAGTVAPPPDPVRGRSLVRFWPGIGPAALAVLLATRTVLAPGLDLAIGLSVAAIFAGVAVAGARRRAWAVPLLVLAPIVFLVTPARTELAFDIARPGDTVWFAFAAAIALASGCCLAGAVAVATHQPAARWAVMPVGVLGAVGFVAVLGLVDPNPDLGRGLDTATRDSLAQIDLIDFGYRPPAGSIVNDGRLQVRLVNDTGLPHTFSVDALDLSVYVPAGRTAFVDVAIPERTTDLAIYCAVGEHRQLGMELLFEAA